MRYKKLIYILLACFLFLQAAFLQAEQQEIFININDAQAVTNKTLSIPTSSDITVFWDTYSRSEEGELLIDSTLCSEFNVIFAEKNDLSNQSTLSVRHTNYARLEKIPVRREIAIVVQGLENGQMICVSDTAWVTSGKISAKGAFESGSWLHWIPFNGRLIMWMIDREEVFDASTKAGKIAFHLLWNFGIIALVIWIFFAGRLLSLSRIFPLKKGPSFGRGFEGIYTSRLRDDFKEIIREWRDIVEGSNHAVRDILRNDNHDKDCPSMGLDDVMLQSAKYWQQEGMDRVHKLLEKTKAPDLKDLPVVRIIRAGLENHELGGLHWMEVSRDVDRAIENRASSELENLRRNSLVDWFWNLGTMAPLIGLFGTATGISHAFSLLTMLRTEITQNALVKQLSSGIYEALWTTILGLFLGIVLMLIYYYYQNKLNWVYSKWEEIYVQVSEKM